MKSVVFGYVVIVPFLNMAGISDDIKLIIFFTFSGIIIFMIALNTLSGINVIFAEVIIGGI
jgi:hypothetical protein